jgi:hypothetical protein
MEAEPETPDKMEAKPETPDNKTAPTAEIWALLLSSYVS